MKKKLLFLPLMSLMLFACGHAEHFTKAETDSIVTRMNGQPKLYLYAHSNLGVLAIGTNPFNCAIDNFNLGAVSLGEFVMYPVKPGQHTISCEQPISGGGGLLGAMKGGIVKGSMTFDVPDSGDTYVKVSNGITTLSALDLKASKEKPEKFEQMNLTKTCTACKL